MPRHRDFPSREEDPYRRINAWDDGHTSPNNNNRSSPPPPYHNDPFYHDNPPYYDNSHRDRSPSPHRHGRPPQASANRPPLTRSKSTSAKAFAKESLATIQHLSPHWQKAAKAAIQAGGVAALAQRKQPGDWAGKKGAKVATAALGAAAADVWANRAKEKKESGDGSRDRRDRTRGGDHRDYDRRDRDRSRDRDHDRRDHRDRSRDRRDRGRDRSRDRDRDYDRRDHGTGASKKRGGGEMEVIGDMLGSFIMDQIAKRGSRARA